MHSKLKTSHTAVKNIDESFKKTFFKNVLISGGYNYVAQALSFFSSIIIARLLSPENYGMVGLITVFTGFISILSDSGISLAIIKSDFGYTYHKSLDTLSLIIGFILFTIMTVLAYPISLFYDNASLILPTILLASTFVFRSLSLVRGALLSKQLAFGYLGKVVLCNTVVTIVMTIALAFYGLEHWSLIIPQIATSLLTVIFYERKIRLGFSYYPYKFYRVAYGYTKSVIGSLIGFNLVNYWSRNSDNLIVGKKFGVDDLGIYNRAYSLLLFPLTLITGLMSAVLYPSLKKLKNEGGDVNSEYMYVLRVICLIVFPISCALLLFPGLIVDFLWGEKWGGVASLLPYFGLLIFSQSLLTSIGNFLVLQGEEKSLMYSGWITSTFTISAIVFGSLFSVVTIVQSYSLCFIMIVLPYNVVFVYHRVLKFEFNVLLVFWAPIIVFSFGIWLGLFLNLLFLQKIFLFLLFCSMVVTCVDEIKSVFIKIKSLRGAR